MARTHRGILGDKERHGEEHQGIKRGALGRQGGTLGVSPFPLPRVTMVSPWGG